MSENRQPRVRPGVTSTILWHFTGGPSRTDIDNFYERKLNQLLPNAPHQEDIPLPRPKEEKDAFCALVNILQDGLLKVFRDYLSFMYYDVSKGTRVIAKMPQEPFCSFCEIPIEHLQYHSARYGKFAIGFYRENLLGLKARPVHYVLSHDDFTLPLFYEIFERLKSLQTAEHMTAEHKTRIEEIGDRVYTIATFLKSFYHTFEFDTVYCEREWRAVIPEREDDGFRFQGEDVCFILSPKNWVEMVRAHVPEKYQQKIVPFEDLLER